MKKYIIDVEEVREEDFYDILEDEVNDYVVKKYDDILDEDYKEVKICGITFLPSQILSQCDPIAYRCGVSDTQSDKLDEANSELDLYGSYEINGKMFRIEDDEDDDYERSWGPKDDEEDEEEQ